MLQTAGTTVRSRRKPFNRPRLISPFSSLPLEAASSDTHTVTNSFHGYWVYPSSPPSGHVPLLGYSNSPFPRLAHYCLRCPSDCHGCSPRLRSVVVLHYLSGGCQRLGFSSNVCNAKTVLAAPAPPLLFFHCRLLRVSFVVHPLFTLLISTPMVFLLIPPNAFICTFSCPPLSQKGISYVAWLVCGWSCTRKTWVNGLFPGTGLEKHRGCGSFFTIASAARSLCSQYLINTKHMI